jgi:hypothetical protein
MFRFSFTSILFILLASTNSFAADYLLRLETAELRELANGKQEPDTTTSESVEILVHAGKAFYSSTLIGKDRVLMNGTLEEAIDGTPRVQIHYQKKSASSESAPSINGQRLPISYAIELKTAMIPFVLGKAVEFDAQITRSKNMRAILLINNFDPSQIPD